MISISLTKYQVLSAISYLLGKKHGSVSYLADELGICSQAVSRWELDKPIPRVHRLHLEINRQDLIEIVNEKHIESTAGEAA